MPISVSVPRGWSWRRGQKAIVESGDPQRMLRVGAIVAALAVAVFAGGIDAEARVACPPAGARLADRDGSNAVFCVPG